MEDTRADRFAERRSTGEDIERVDGIGQNLD